MDSVLAFALGQANKGKERKVFDWDKAARLIKESGTKNAQAGLKEDYEWTGGVIYSDGRPVSKDYTYLASVWATPTLYLDENEVDCYVMESKASWDSDTKWPPSAIAILRAGKEVQP